MLLKQHSINLRNLFPSLSDVHDYATHKEVRTISETQNVSGELECSFRHEYIKHGKQHYGFGSVTPCRWILVYGPRPEQNHPGLIEPVHHYKQAASCLLYGPWLLTLGSQSLDLGKRVLLYLFFVVKARVGLLG